MLGVNLFPINVLPVSDISKALRAILDKLKELRSHFNNEHACINVIYDYIEEQDIEFKINYLEKIKDPLIYAAVHNLHKALILAYEKIHKYKDAIFHTKCVEYEKIIKDIDKCVKILDNRLKFYVYSTIID